MSGSRDVVPILVYLPLNMLPVNLCILFLLSVHNRGYSILRLLVRATVMIVIVVVVNAFDKHAQNISTTDLFRSHRHIEINLVPMFETAWTVIRPFTEALPVGFGEVIIKAYHGTYYSYYTVGSAVSYFSLCVSRIERPVAIFLGPGSAQMLVASIYSLSLIMVGKALAPLVQVLAVIWRVLKWIIGKFSRFGTSDQASSFARYAPVAALAIGSSIPLTAAYRTAMPTYAAYDYRQQSPLVSPRSPHPFGEPPGYDEIAHGLEDVHRRIEGIERQLTG